MIVKHIRNPKSASSKASRTGNLIDYITADAHESAEKTEMLGASGAFLTDSAQGQRAEMIALAEIATRSKDPVDHWLLSWKEGEQPTTEQCGLAVDTLKKHLRMSTDHLAIFALHSNTENYHLHVVMNRVDPITLRVADKGWCIDRAHKAVAEIVREQGWEPETNARYLERPGEISEFSAKVPTKAISAKARDFENATGEKSAERIASERAAPVLLAAQSWEEVHDRLGALGMRYELQGSGAVIWVGYQPVKASMAGRACSKSQMEKRLGIFHPKSGAPPLPSLNRAPEPLCAEMLPRWRKFKEAKDDHQREMREAAQFLRARHREELQDLCRTFKQERQTLNHGADWSGAALNVARNLLAGEHARRKAELIEKQRNECKKLRKRFGNAMGWEGYLLKQNEQQMAQSWRYRGSTVHTGTMSGEGDDSIQIRDIRDFVATVRQTNERRFTAIEYSRKNCPKQVCFADRGRRIDVNQISDEVAVLAAFQLAVQKWGVVTVDGSMEFKLLCGELAAKHGFRISNPEMRPQSRQEPDPASPSHRANAYQAHRSDILKRIDVPNPSRLDWIIAMRMRVTGHTKEAIVAALETNAPEHRRTEARDWSKYARRTADAVFGPRGDREFQSCKGRASGWLRLEGRVSVPTIIRRKPVKGIERG